VRRGRVEQAAAVAVRWPVRRAIPLLAFLPLVAVAQAFDGSQALDTYTGPVLASGRVTGLAGAYVGIGEGLAGLASNPASIAQRRRHLDRPWDVDGLLTWYLPQLDDVSRQDLDNDGAVDGALLGRANLQLGAGGQAGRLGGGILARTWVAGAGRSSGGRLEISIEDVSLAAGWSVWRDAVVVGASITAGRGVVRWYDAAGAEQSRLDYQASSLRLGALWRPRGAPWRLGVTWDPGARATPLGATAAFPVPVPTAFLFPWTLSIGASAWLGPNARRYNEPPPFALDVHPEWGEGPVHEPSRRRPVLVSAQLDVVGPAAGAVSLQSALVEGAPALASGTRPSLLPRLGAEWESWPDVLRVRGGTYLEPSRTGGGPRPHGTFGLEVRVPCWPWDLQVALGGDVARRLRNVSLSIGWWSDLGPVRAGASEQVR
jgi:hypothetical protein